MITTVVGPMFSGKTFDLLMFFKRYLDIFIFDPCNSRDTARDLKNLAKDRKYSPGISESEKRKVSIIDELELENFIKDKINLDQRMSNQRNYLEYCEGKGNADSLLLEKSCLLIDEVHLFEVLKKEKYLFRIIQNLGSLESINIFFAGLLLDCYNNYRIFPVWTMVMGNSDHIIYKKSRNPCAFCGSQEFVLYTTPKLNAERIGDDYYNLCYDCVKEEKLLQDTLG